MNTLSTDNGSIPVFRNDDVTPPPQSISEQLLPTLSRYPDVARFGWGSPDDEPSTKNELLESIFRFYLTVQHFVPQIVRHQLTVTVNLRFFFLYTKMCFQVD